MSATLRVLGLTAAQLHVARELAGEMRPPLTAPGRPQCAIFLTMVEQFEATLILAQAGLASHGATHVRAMLEAFVALKLLADKPQHVEQMQYEQLRGEKRLYERVLKFPELVGDYRNKIEEQLASCLARFQPLHDRNVRPVQLIEQFEHAGMGALAGPYSMLCSFAHNDLAALAFRHQGEKGMTLRAGDTPDFVVMVLSTATFALFQAAAMMGGIALFDEGKFDHHMQKMVALHEAMMNLDSEPGAGAPPPHPIA